MLLSTFTSRCRVDEIDIWRAADRMIKLHGDRAATEAAARADVMLAQDNSDGFRIWQRIVTRIGDLDRQKLRASE